MKKFYINKKLYLVLLYIISNNFKKNFNLKLYNSIFDRNYEYYYINYSIINCISKIFFLIPYIINKDKTKNKEKTNITNKYSKKFILYNKNENNKVKIKFESSYLIFAFSFITFFAIYIYQSSDYFFSISTIYFQYDEYFSIITFVLYQIIFEIKFYNFHYISILILILILIIKNFVNIYYNELDFIDNLKVNLTNIILRILFSIGFILIKYLNIVYYIDMFFIYFISNGILHFIFFNCYQFILTGNFIEYIDFSFSKIFYYVIYIIIDFINSYIIIGIINYLDPIYYAFADLIFISINYFIDNYEIYNLFIIIIISLLDLVSVFIYSELIELKCFNLNRNTMNNMINRAEIEFKLSRKYFN